MFVILDHDPILFFHPMILPLMKLCACTRVFESIVELSILTPAPILQLAPITTFGPSTAVGSTSAVGCTIIPLF